MQVIHRHQRPAHIDHSSHQCRRAGEGRDLHRRQHPPHTLRGHRQLVRRPLGKPRTLRRAPAVPWKMRIKRPCLWNRAPLSPCPCSALSRFRGTGIFFSKKTRARALCFPHSTSMKPSPLLASLLAAAALHAEPQPALTIYNQNFAVVRDTVPLTLSRAKTLSASRRPPRIVEPDSVILRDPAGKMPAANPRAKLPQRSGLAGAAPLAESRAKRSISSCRETGLPDRTVQGKIIRSGYAMHSQMAMQRYGQRYAQQQRAMYYGGGFAPEQPIIEVAGKLQFSLPGQPIFPTLGDDTILKPTLEWQLQTRQPAQLDAEARLRHRRHVLGGRLQRRRARDQRPLDIVGWVTMDNQSGKTFANAKIKLMAGDVSKIQPAAAMTGMKWWQGSLWRQGAPPPPPSRKKPSRTTTFTRCPPRDPARPRDEAGRVHPRRRRSRSQKFTSTTASKSTGTNGAATTSKAAAPTRIRQRERHQIAVMREFKNSEANHLGMPLPQGRVRFYKQDADGQAGVHRRKLHRPHSQG